MTIFRRRLVLLSLIAFFAAFVSFGAWMYHYTESDPKFCRSCHIMEDAWTLWATGPHKDVTCHSCHVQNLQDRATIVWEWAVGHHEKVAPHTHLDTKICLTCHSSQNGHWKQIAGTPGHQIHVSRVRLDCLQCHYPSLHRFRADAKDCKRCHSKIRINAEGMEDFHCLSCHPFLTQGDERAIRPTREICLSCHLKGKTADETQALSENETLAMDCTQCHKPHGSGKPTNAECLSCHPDALTEPVHVESSATSNCKDCHDSHHPSLRIPKGAPQ